MLLRSIYTHMLHTAPALCLDFKAYKVSKSGMNEENTNMRGIMNGKSFSIVPRLQQHGEHIQYRCQTTTKLSKRCQLVKLKTYHAVIW